MILTIGAFDGFHRGHERLLDGARELASKSAKLKRDDWGVVTFEPHPGVFMGALKATLFTPRERELVRRVLGVPHMFVLRFDETLKNLSPQEFWEKLKRDFHAKGVVMGRDFRFGHNQSGSAEILAELCRHDGFPAKIVELEEYDGVRCSSTGIRGAIASGDVHAATELLGYSWFMCCKVTHGYQRGRAMGFPTANLDLAARAHDGGIIPADGVYAAAILVSTGDNASETCLTWYGGALSIGVNPTFGDVRDTRAEVFALDFHGDLYGREVSVLLLKRLRPMKKFLDAESLELQIAQDVERCREIFEMTRTTRLDFLEKFAESFSRVNATKPEA